MTTGSFWAPLLFCLLQMVLGSPKLARPQNVTLLFRNFSVYLTWRPGPNYPPNVTYEVRYQSFENEERWKKVKHCMGITMEECDLTCLKHQSLHIKYKGRVRAMASGTFSLWAESPKYLDYLFDDEIPGYAPWDKGEDQASLRFHWALLSECTDTLFINHPQVQQLLPTKLFPAGHPRNPTEDAGVVAAIFPDCYYPSGLDVPPEEHLFPAGKDASKPGLFWVHMPCENLGPGQTRAQHLVHLP